VGTSVAPPSAMTSHSTPDSTAALDRARTRLAKWQAGVREARELRARLAPEAQAAVQPLLQELQDRCDRSEIEVLRPQQ
jgi:hypothetical protein